MSDKLAEYEGLSGRIQVFKDNAHEKWEKFKDWKSQIPTDRGFAGVISFLRGPPKLQRCLEDYNHIYRRKTRMELIRVSAAVMGIEFSYAAETAFVSPTLLKIGVDHRHMTLVWALSPLVGFFVTPILGSVSDRCRLKYGRRRPFIFLLSIGVLLGLILVPNGEKIGYIFGDLRSNFTTVLGHRTTGKTAKNETILLSSPTAHCWGIFFTILGTVLLDFDADACQSPARAYLLDVTLPEDHAKGLSTFTIMAGLGGFMGYGLGGINWDATALGIALGGHLHATFTLITIIFLICVINTLISFKEIPLDFLESDECKHQLQEMLNNQGQENENAKIADDDPISYGAITHEEEINNENIQEISVDQLPKELNQSGKEPMTPDIQSHNYTNVHSVEDSNTNPKATLHQYLFSIINMPHSMRMVCITNLFCWMAHVCYSLYFTDFVGEAVYGGNPRAPEGSEERELYESGVRFGCWGMSMYSLSCSCYSLIIEKLIHRYRARKVYIYGLLFYSCGMMMMAFTQHPAGVIIFSWTAGVMYSTLFTMPYLLIAHYHASGIFTVTETGETVPEGSVRGLGTDIAIVSSMVFLAQFLLSCCLGSIVSASGTTTAIICVASTLAACGAVAATQIMYLDL